MTTSGSNKCDHKYVHLRSHVSKERGSYNNTYSLTDVYYCERCLDEKTKVKSEDRRQAPDWWLAASPNHSEY